MPSRCVTLIVLSLLLVGCRARLDSERRGQVQWGEPVDGLQAGLSVNHYRPGKKAWLSVTYAIRNVGQAPLRVMSLPHYTGASRYYPTRGPLEIQIAGQRPRWIEPMDGSRVPESAYDFLEPGAQATLTGGIDPGHYRLGGTFDARLTFVYEVHSPPNAQAVEGAAQVWTGRARSAPVRAPVRF